MSDYPRAALKTDFDALRYRSNTRIIHKQCNSRLYYVKLAALSDSYYACRGCTNCWYYEVIQDQFDDSDLEIRFVVMPPEDDTVYKLCFNNGDKNSPTHYYLRPATPEETEQYHKKERYDGSVVD